ncbi:hypothetical protein G6F50_017877 [Rhizopus delemar]|uniref:Uncharacterized protein n=1 Tax=Rhizopus delemar TaxID=936053 RepID=A0A9P7BZ58_9FUNG|nr:hypothetical protein G6F50_017877 [Rhizopus delemar]
MASVSTGANGIAAGRLAGAHSRRRPGARALKAWRGSRTSRREVASGNVMANADPVARGPRARGKGQRAPGFAG